MQLSIVINSVRRYWYVFMVCTLLGTLPGAMKGTGDAPRYESRAVLLVSPPSESRVQVSFTNDPDRYVIGQLSVLRSASMAERVATAVGEGETTASVLAATTIEHSPNTDIVDVIAVTPDPEQSRRIADAYLDVYFQQLTDEVSETRQPEIDALDAELTAIQNEIDAVDAELALVMSEYLPGSNVLSAGSFAPIPQPEQVAPGLVSDRTILLSQYNQLLSSRTALVQLDISAKLRITSQVVQRATLPTDPVPESDGLLVAAGLLAGAFVGVVLCVVIGRISETAVDEHQIAEVLGTPLFGELPRSRTLVKSRRTAVEGVPHRLVPFLNSLAVQAESNADVGETFTVVVVGTERAAGATTLAGALANRFAANGSQVLLVDADARDSELTRLFAEGSGGIPALIAEHVNHGGMGRTDRSTAFSATSVRGLSIVGIGGRTGLGSLRRQSLPDLVDAARAHAHVVVFDGGPLLDSVTSVQLTQLVDAVVLAVPMRGLSTRNLARVAAQLSGRRGELLPVLVPARRSQARSAAGDPGPASLDAEGGAFQQADDSWGEPDVETVASAPRARGR